MYKQLDYLRESVDMPLNATYRIDLPKTGMLSSMLVKVSANCTSGATLAGGAWRLLDFLGKLEIIVNGATVVKSCDVTDLHFLSWLHQGIVPPHFWRNYATNTQFEYFLVNFGRYLGDPEYGLDLSRYNSAELRLTNSATATNYSTDITLSMLNVYMRDMNGSFKGYLRSEEWRKWTTVQAATEYNILPTEYPISLIALSAVPHATLGMFDTNGQNLMDTILLSKGGGVKQMYQGGYDDLMVTNYLDRGAEVITSGIADLTADRGIQTSIQRMFGFAGISGSKDGAVSAVIPTMIADATDGAISFEAREADSPVEFTVRGMGFMNYAWLVNDPDLDPAGLLDPKVDGECRLDITTRDAATAAAGTNKILLERLVSG
jgi:hypothetical protein